MKNAPTEVNLNSLGFDDWVDEHLDLLQPDQCLARVTAVERGAFLVRNQDGEIMAELAGRFRFSAESAVDLPCVGDWVFIQKTSANSPSVIQAIVPRRTFLRRKCAGKKVAHQMIAANLDTAFIVQSCHQDFNLRRLDRYLAMTREGGVQPWIILSKSDLLEPEDLRQRIEEIRNCGIRDEILALSNATGDGTDEFKRNLVPGKTYCLLGSSGVGKTTLINRLLGRNEYKTCDVSSTGEGVHTTTRRQLLRLDEGALLIDTPGMRELGMLEAGEGMDECFAEFQSIALQCRYSNCKHTVEPGCAVLAAIENGELNEDRYQSYQKLKRECDFHDLSYEQKRKKDRDFGRHVKTTLKHLSKYQ